MKLSKSLIKKFNQPDSLLVISPYPLKGTVHTGGGIASYTKNTLLAIKKANPDKKIIVLANIADGKAVYLEKGILVIRCWDRRFPVIYSQLLRKISHFLSVKNILFEFEFAAYGDIFCTASIGLLIGGLKLMQFNITSVVHQVVISLNELAVHTGLSQNPNQITLYNGLLRSFYSLINLSSNQLVTLEEPLADRFNKIADSNKAVAIPHGLYPQKPMNKRSARARLNLDQNSYYVLAFGYLSHYKGSDIAVKSFVNKLVVNGKPVKLIIAGGESPTQGQKRHYQRFYKSLYKTIDNNPNIIHTGFVPGTRIKTYFSAADLVIFPYRTFMSASGPLSLAIAHGRPFVASHKLNNYTKFTFDNNPKSIRTLVKELLTDRKKMKQADIISKKMRIDRNFKKQGRVYLDLIERGISPIS